MFTLHGDRHQQRFSLGSVPILLVQVSLLVTVGVNTLLGSWLKFDHTTKLPSQGLSSNGMAVKHLKLISIVVVYLCDVNNIDGLPILCKFSK